MMRSIAMSSVFALGLFAAAPALAGFEWVPPAQAPAPVPQQQAAQPDMQSMPSYGYAPQGQMMQPTPMPAPAMTMHYPPVQEQGYYAGAQAFANPVPPAPVPSASAGGLTINPYPLVQAGYAPTMMNTGTVEGAMLSASNTLNPVQLGNGMTTGGKARPIAPSIPAAAPQMMQQGAAMQPAINMGMAPTAGTSLSAMPGGNPAPMAVYGYDGQPVSGAYAAPQVMRAPIAAPPPAPVAAAPLTPPPAVMDRGQADNNYPVHAQTAMMQPPVETPRPPMAQPASLPAQSNLPDAVGFGKDLPLALALSQIIPGDYALFFESAVDSETTVSWQGGKAWDQVLQEMLAPLGLRAVIQPNLVMIRSA